MNKFIKFLVSIILISASSAYAQRTVKVDVFCDDAKTMIKALLDNEEQPVIVSKSDVDETLVIMVWMSKNGDMTVTQASPQVMCLIASGFNAKYRQLPASPVRNY